MPASILILDDESTLRTFLTRTLHDQGYETLPAATVADALDLVHTRHIDCALLDQNLPDGRGLDVLRALKKVDADLPVIVMTGYGSLDGVKAAIRQGAYDYVTKPVDLTELKRLLGQALETVGLRREIRRLRADQLQQASDVVIGRSSAMHEITHLIQRVAASPVSVLIQGESGTGKEIVARLIYHNSQRAAQSFIAINCAAIPEHLLESELFGYEAGAFTGAKRQKKGIIELADRGTLFLDEIGSMKLEMQAKLLRVLETRELRRLGGTQDTRVDLRVIAATNRDLRAAIETGEFREDLYWRLAVVEIDLPPLRDRVEDIDLFVAKFVSDFARLFAKDIRDVSPEALEALRSHRWPGNVRELRNVLERAAILCEGPEISLEHLPADLVAHHKAAPATPRPGAILPPGGVDLKRTVADLEHQLITQAMEQAGGNQTLAAQILSISRDELRYRLQKRRGAERQEA